MPPVAIIAGLHLMTAILVVLLAVPLVLGLVPPNRWYGVRLRKAFVSEANWYALNRFGGALLVLWGLGLGAVALAARSAPLGPADPRFVVIALAPLLLLGPVVVLVLWRAHRLPG